MEGCELPSPLDAIYQANPLQLVQVWTGCGALAGVAGSVAGLQIMGCELPSPLNAIYQANPLQLVQVWTGCGAGCCAGVEHGGDRVFFKVWGVWLG